MPAVPKRKVLKVGGSGTVALPPHWLDPFKLDIGDELELIYDSIVSIKPAGIKLNPVLSRKKSRY